MDVELLRKLCQCSIALGGGKRHLRLEGRCVVPAWSSWHGSLLIRRAQRARRQAETPPIVLSRFPRPALIFLAESRKSHKDAILLLDEPGLHLHPTLQTQLVRFL